MNETQAMVLNLAMAIVLFSKKADGEGQTVMKINLEKAVKAYYVGNTRDEAFRQQSESQLVHICIK